MDNRTVNAAAFVVGGLLGAGYANGKARIAVSVCLGVAVDLDAAKGKQAPSRPVPAVERRSARRRANGAASTRAKGAPLAAPRRQG